MSQEQAAAVELRGVFQHVGPHAALADIDLCARAGEWLLIAGPNGAGKSLMARLILGLDAPSAGSVKVLGQDLGRLGWRAMTRLRARIGAVLQGGSLIADRNVTENLLLPLRAQPGGRERLAREVRLAVGLMRLDGLEDRSPRALSIGQQRRVELARALIHRPELLIWDGLTDGLDPGAARETLELLRTLRQTRQLTLIALDRNADALGEDCDRVAVLGAGRLAFQGTPAALRAALPERLDLRYLLYGRP